jgi:hypothetical protein
MGTLQLTLEQRDMMDKQIRARVLVQTTHPSELPIMTKPEGSNSGCLSNNVCPYVRTCINHSESRTEILCLGVYRSCPSYRLSLYFDIVDELVDFRALKISLVGLGVDRRTLASTI